ncbi:hypothetical protein K6I73_002908 [Salmonella enterica subsp. diarizonae serovar 35:k:e,n,x,z15]|nr:hypothetical protein [Salmonella enterica]EAW1263598.1 hypothetical protein [Salmonella enterica subsp. diarizonae]EIE2763283.1 hypothetical protein [Salmonella enterica subsp. diarizonae serovar 35:k:e,n,x,z15]EBF9340425.1 hypothetical protein [Salmonella enterica]EBK4296698.1 hypothetical protein [Salmonella enterica]
MPLPVRLTPTEIHHDKMQSMTSIAEELTNLIDTGSDETSSKVYALIEKWNIFAVTRFEFSDFRDYYSWISTENFVKTALYQAKYQADLSFHEAKQIIEFISTAEGNEALQGYALSLIELNFSEPCVSDLFYYPEYWFKNDSMSDVNLTYDEILGYLMKKSGRWLPDAPEIDLPYPLPA